MASYQIEIKNLDALRAAFKKSPQIAEKNIQKAIIASAAEVQKNARRGTVPWRTGNLVQSFGNGITIGRLIARISPTARYAVYVHEGTKPHVIKPKTGKALFWPGASHPVRSVKHPGTKPNRFMLKVAEKAKKTSNGILSVRPSSLPVKSPPKHKPMSWVSIRAKINTLLNTLVPATLGIVLNGEQFQEKDEISAWPAAEIVRMGTDPTYLDNRSDLQVYLFEIRLYQQLQAMQTASVETSMDAVVDTVMTTFLNDVHLTGTLEPRMTPIAMDPGVISWNGQNVRRDVIRLRCPKITSMA